jgi:hypothetical protein
MPASRRTSARGQRVGRQRGSGAGPAWLEALAGEDRARYPVARNVLASRPRAGRRPPHTTCRARSGARAARSPARWPPRCRRLVVDADASAVRRRGRAWRGARDRCGRRADDALDIVGVGIARRLEQLRRRAGRRRPPGCLQRGRQRPGLGGESRTLRSSAGMAPYTLTSHPPRTGAPGRPGSTARRRTSRAARGRRRPARRHTHCVGKLREGSRPRAQQTDEDQQPAGLFGCGGLGMTAHHPGETGAHEFATTSGGDSIAGRARWRRPSVRGALRRAR